MYKKNEKKTHSSNDSLFEIHEDSSWYEYHSLGEFVIDDSNKLYCNQWKHF